MSRACGHSCKKASCEKVVDQAQKANFALNSMVHWEGAPTISGGGIKVLVDFGSFWAKNACRAVNVGYVTGAKNPPPHNLLCTAKSP
jgi:hypothetical protein